MSKKIFLDYQSTTPVSDKVLKKMLPYFTEKFANPHSNNHSLGRETNEVVEKTRQQVAKLINAEPNEIVFTSGATESNNLALKVLLKIILLVTFKSLLVRPSINVF